MLFEVVTPLLYRNSLLFVTPFTEVDVCYVLLIGIPVCVIETAPLIYYV